MKKLTKSEFVGKSETTHGKGVYDISEFTYIAMILEEHVLDIIQEDI